MDTLDPERLKKIMRFGTLEEIEAGIAAAEEAGLTPIKINCVVTRDYNDKDVVDLARRARERGWHVRFIELMPLGGGETAHLALSQFVPSRETRERIEAELGPLVPAADANPSDESRNYRFADGAGIVGFISPVSEPYCGTCNRMRLTADGKLHLCLLNDDELDVKKALRGGRGSRGGGDPARARSGPSPPAIASTRASPRRTARCSRSAAESPSSRLLLRGTRSTPRRPRRTPSSRSAPSPSAVSIAWRQASNASARWGEAHRHRDARLADLQPPRGDAPCTMASHRPAAACVSAAISSIRGSAISS